MRVLLINPRNQYNAGQNETWAKFPLGLLYVAAGMLGHDCYIVDLNMDHDIDLEEVIRDFQPDKIGISCWMDNFLSTEEIIATIKSVSNAKIIAGGPFATVAPQTYLDLGVDEVQKGAFCFPSSDDLIAAYRQHFPLERMEKYLAGGDKYSTHKVAMVVTSFSCPHNCIFCSSKYLCGYKERNLQDVEAEITFLKETYGINAIYFTDASVAIRRNRAIEICKIAKKLQIEWYAETRVDELDEELVNMMADSGCRELLIGIESFDQDALNSTSKRTTRQQINGAIRMIKSAKIDLVAFILLGLPDQTENQIDEAIKEIERLKIAVLPNMLFPIPGTKVWKIAEEQGKAPNIAELARRISSDYDATGRACPSINLTQVSDEYLIEAVREIHHLNEQL